MSASAFPLALLLLHKDGSAFPVSMGIPTHKEAERALAWNKIGQGQFEQWAVVDAVALRDLLHAGKVSLSCFTAEAQARKTAFIESLGTEGEA